VDFQAQAMFELLKLPDQESMPWMRDNMQRYQASQPALQAWPDNADVFRPARLGPAALTAAQSQEASPGG